MPEDPKSKRAGTIIGDRGEYRPRVITPPEGVVIVPDEFAEAKQPVTGVGLTPIVELGARVERARSDSAASATAITSQLAEHAEAIKGLQTGFGELGGEFKTLGKEVGVMGKDVAGLVGEFKHVPSLIQQLQKANDRAAEKDQVTFTASVRVGEAQQLDAIDGRKARRWFLFKIFTSGVIGAVVLKALQHYGVL